MPLAQITLVEGASEDQKRTLIAEVTAAIAGSLDQSPQAVRVLLNEIPAAHWGVAGVSMKDRAT
jgi:4-oxalocrotonate tautomerase